jgi:hypothetical protein
LFHLRCLGTPVLSISRLFDAIHQRCGIEEPAVAHSINKEEGPLEIHSTDDQSIARRLRD